MLHILKSPPDDTTIEWIESLRDEDGMGVVRLYEPVQDWDRVIERIWEHQNVICWW